VLAGADRGSSTAGHGYRLDLRKAQVYLLRGNGQLVQSQCRAPTHLQVRVFCVCIPPVRRHGWFGRRRRCAGASLDDSQRPRCRSASGARSGVVPHRERLKPCCQSCHFRGVGGKQTHRFVVEGRAHPSSCPLLVRSRPQTPFVVGTDRCP